MSGFPVAVSVVLFFFFPEKKTLREVFFLKQNVISYFVSDFPEIFWEKFLKYLTSILSPSPVRL